MITSGYALTNDPVPSLAFGLASYALAFAAWRGCP